MLISLAQATTETAVNGVGAVGAGIGLIFLIIYIALIALVLAGFWKTLAKAGYTGALALILLIPIVNLYVIYLLCKIAGRPGWWVILFIIPIVNIVISIIVSLDIAKSFGKGAGFGIGLWLLPFIFYPIVGFGDAKYQGPGGGGQPPAAPQA